MSTTPITTTSALPGAAVLARARRLIVFVLVAALVYSLVTVSSRGYCADAFESCVGLDLRPSLFVYAALVIIVLGALSRVLRRAETVARAVVILDRATVAAIAVALGSALISVVWFHLIPIQTWDGTGALWFPFPFAAVELTTTG